MKLFTKTELTNVIATICGVDPVKYQANLVRGMKPVKALTKLGADQRTAQLVGLLKLAVTTEEINNCYADSSIKSCMTGKPVGEFYSLNQIGVIYGPDFRLLVGLESWGLAPRAYGFKCEATKKLLQPHFTNTDPGILTGELVSKRVLVDTSTREVPNMVQVVHTVLRLTTEPTDVDDALRLIELGKFIEVPVQQDKDYFYNPFFPGNRPSQYLWCEGGKYHMVYTREVQQGTKIEEVYTYEDRMVPETVLSSFPGMYVPYIDWDSMFNHYSTYWVEAEQRYMEQEESNHLVPLKEYIKGIVLEIERLMALVESILSEGEDDINDHLARIHQLECELKALS